MGALTRSEALAGARDLAVALNATILACFNRRLPDEQPKPTAAAFRAAHCALQHSSSQHVEELLMLPSLVLMAGGLGARGVFVELGAYDGITYSHTLALERCFNWTGLLIEANPRNFEKLSRANRRVTKVNSAVCNRTGSVGFMARGGVASSEANFISAANTSRISTVDVPCRPLTAIMRDAGYEYADFLSLDVQGAEYKVLQAAQPSAFGYIMTEVYGQGAAVAMARRHVQELLSNAGMVQLLPQQLDVFGSSIYAQPGATAVPVRRPAHRLREAGVHMRRCASKVSTPEKLRSRISRLDMAHTSGATPSKRIGRPTRFPAGHGEGVEWRNQHGGTMHAANTTWRRAVGRRGRVAGRNGRRGERRQG